MAKNDNPNALRLLASVEQHVSREAAEQIASKYSLAKSAEFDKKFIWAKAICEELNQQFDEKTVKEIRMDCACGPEEGKIKKLKKLYDSCANMEEFVAKANRLEQGFTMRYENGVLFLVYPQCYCSCVKRVDETLPKCWCYCTVGYTRKMFGGVFGREVQAELIDSVKLGGKECIIRIE